MTEQQYIPEILRTYAGSDDPMSKLTLGALKEVRVSRSFH